MVRDVCEDTQPLVAERRLARPQPSRRPKTDPKKRVRRGPLKNTMPSSRPREVSVQGGGWAGTRRAGGVLTHAGTASSPPPSAGAWEASAMATAGATPTQSGLHLSRRLP